MQATDLEEIKAVLWEQASHLCTRVSWGVAQVMAVRRNKGQLLVLLRGRGRWHPVSAVTIERPRLCPTGACDIYEETNGILSQPTDEGHEVTLPNEAYTARAASSTGKSAETAG